MIPTIERIDHVIMNTLDVEVTADWYVKVLGFRRETFGPRPRLPYDTLKDFAAVPSCSRHL